jgi:phage tail-like protein
VDAPRTYRYLNREGRWLDFHWVGLELLGDGALELDSLPLLDVEVPPGVAELPSPSGPSGVAAAHGFVFFTDPSTHALWLVDDCDATVRAAPCLTGPGDGPDQLQAPRSLLYHPGRDALLVADSGNARVQVFALPDIRLTESWDAAGRLVEPVSLAGDSAGNVYVADARARVVRKLDVLGQEIADFADTVASYRDLVPAEVAAVEIEGADRVYVLDADTARVHVLDVDGRRHDRWETSLAQPMGLAAVGRNVYLGDNATRRLVVFAHDGRRIGVAYGYAGPIGAVAADRRGGLLAHPGGQTAPLRLSLSGAFGTRGVLWGGPFANPSDGSDPRHRIRARFTAPDANAHHQLFVHTQRAGGTRPPVHPHAAEPFGDPRWRAVAPDAIETLVQGAFDDEVWVGLVLTGEGRSSSRLEQIRIDFDYETLLQHLPALYERDEDSADLLARWLTLYESMFDYTQAGIDRLPLLFDPAAAPRDWLSWLARWLALELPEAWDDDRRRRAIAEAFARAGRRGTVDGLRSAIGSEAGVDVLIEEPIVQTGWWALADEGAPPAQAALSVLGVGTVLAAGEAQGAVAGTTAVLDGSFLSPQDEYARPLFAEVAHRFTIRLYRGQKYSDIAAATVRELLERERPAHTTYHLCVVEPRMRVGVQARVGVDAVVAGPVDPTRLDDKGTTEVVLGGPFPGRLGVTSSVGVVRLTDSVTDR